MITRDVVTTTPIIRHFAEPVSWVGAGRTPGELCVGFETGRLQFTDMALNPTTDFTPVFGSGEAINGAAFFGDKFAVTTRGEIIIGVDPIRRSTLAFCPGGAHGIVGNERGTMVAPLGAEGLWRLHWTASDRFDQRTLKLLGGEPYFYQTVLLGRDQQGFDLFASACRSNGLILTPIGPDGTVGNNRIIIPGDVDPLRPFDIIGVCSLQSSDHPTALAILGMDGTVYFARDWREGSFTRMLRDNVRATPYSIHCAQGHLFIHTSEGTTAIRDIARFVLQGAALDSKPRTLTLFADAVDCAVINDEYLVVIEAERITSTAIGDLFPNRLDSSTDRLTEPGATPTRDFSSFDWSLGNGYQVNAAPSGFLVHTV